MSRQHLLAITSLDRRSISSSQYTIIGLNLSPLAYCAWFGFLSSLRLALRPLYFLSPVNISSPPRHRFSPYQHIHSAVPTIDLSIPSLDCPPSTHGFHFQHHGIPTRTFDYTPQSLIVNTVTVLFFQNVALFYFVCCLCFRHSLNFIIGIGGIHSLMLPITPLAFGFPFDWSYHLFSGSRTLLLIQNLYKKVRLAFTFSFICHDMTPLHVFTPSRPPSPLHTPFPAFLLSIQSDYPYTFLLSVLWVCRLIPDRKSVV